jgi:hypothetical protein
MRINEWDEASNVRRFRIYVHLKNLFIHLSFVDGESPRKKPRETASILCEAHNTVSVIFPRVIPPSTYKMNKSIPYHLIISRHAIK